MSTPRIVSRAQWGAKPWRTTRPRVPLSARRYFVLHYHGGAVSQQYGNAVPRNIEAIHLANGWSGVGYNWVIDQAGVIYEGHGWHLRGAHSPPHNVDGIGVYIAVGGDQVPSGAAKCSARWLYDEQRRLTGRTPLIWWHGRDFPTACPGPHLIAWARAGMPVAYTPARPGPSAPSIKEWDEMASREEVRAEVKAGIKEALVEIEGRKTPADRNAGNAAWKIIRDALKGGLVEIARRGTALDRRASDALRDENSAGIIRERQQRG